MSNAVVFILVLSVLVVVHEFGHFLMAKLAGIRVERFSIGFGPVLFGKNIGGTEFVFSLLPLGGFVKMAGEDPGDSKGKPWEFNSKPLFWKFFVVFAGPFMNALLAVVLFSVVFVTGEPLITAKIGKVMAGAPAEAAGLKADDKILSVNGKAVAYWDDVLREVRKGEGNIGLVIEREGESLTLQVTPKHEVLSKSLTTKKKAIPFIGIAPSSDIVTIKHPLFEAVGLAVRRVMDMTGLILYSLALLFTGGLSFKDSMTGPIGIFFMTGQAAQMGMAPLLYFMGSLSVSLFVLNLLPIPVLDGGHVLFILIDKIKGSPLKESVKERMTQGGMAVLLALMTFVILQDVQRFSIIENIKNLFVRS